MINPSNLKQLPAAEEAYLARLAQILQRQLGERLVGVYLFGSGAAGAYEPGVSDLDVQAVVAESLSIAERGRLAAKLSHQALPCPARKLEFVCYTAGAIRPVQRHPAFELNFNTGAGMRDHLALNPAEEASHWFLLDIALGRVFGRSLVGPPVASVFAPVPRCWVLAATLDSLTWHQANERTSANAVLNACRAWRYARTGELGSKRDGAAWAQTQTECPPIVAQAEQLRQGNAPLEASEVAAFDMLVVEHVRQAYASECEELNRSQ